MALLLSCSGGGGVGGAPGDSGQWAAGPMSIPAPVTINKGMIQCDNVPGPTVQCRGSDGAAPANARIRLTVYSRFADVGWEWSDLFISRAHAIPGNTNFCDANGAGAFGQGGECSVIASAGEKVGLCVASGGSCAGPELILLVPVEGGSVSGSTATIKSMSVDADGGILTSRRLPRWKQWLSRLFLGTAYAEEVPTLSLPEAKAATCPGRAVPSLEADAELFPPDSYITIRKKLGDAPFRDLFRFPGNREKLQAIYAHNIGNAKFYSAALGNHLLMFYADTVPVPVAHFVFPYPIQGLAGDLEIYLQNVKDGMTSVYEIQGDYFGAGIDAVCVERAGFSTSGGFDGGLGYYTPPGEGYHVPESIVVSVGVGQGSDGQQVYLKQDAFGTTPAFEGIIYRQNALLKNPEILRVTPQFIVVAVLDPEANRLLFLHRRMEDGAVTVTPLNLSGLTESPVVFRAHDNPSEASLRKLLILDSHDRGAKVVALPYSVEESGVVTVNTGQAQIFDLGPYVVDSLENYPGRERHKWVTVDLLTGLPLPIELPTE